TDSKPVSITTNGNIVIIESSATNLGNVPGGFPQLFRITSSYWDEGGTTCSTNDTTCDGVDDDCDGQTDEDYVTQSTSCGIGACFATGVTDCQSGATVNTCVPLTGAPNDPSCDGIDDDCDGPFDEDYVTVPSSCGFGPCAATGIATCVAGQIVDSCTPGVPPATDDSLCDGIDNDCDGQIDEDCIICIPSTCQEYNINCGTVDDGCGVSLDCGTCQSPETCGGGGFSNICGAGLPPDPVDIAPQTSVGTGGFLDDFSFLTGGANPVQSGVQPDAIESQRAAVIRGRVLSTNDQPISNVKIFAPKDMNLGQTVSRADGHFDLIVNGGGLVTLQFEAVGYLPVQRTMSVPWEDFVNLEDVAMTPASDVATVVTFDLAESQVAESRPVTDQDGTRQIAAYFPSGTQAVVEVNGESLPLNVGTLRMTEYTTGNLGPQAMPAHLPENSEYTFAADLSFDEVEPLNKVTFNQMTYFYLDNFLGFPEGAVVPNGSYDYEQARWVAEKDGIVMKVVGVTPEGLAEIDATHDETDPLDDSPESPEDLALLGVADAERAKIAERFAIGDSFWRMPIEHLSTYDWNHSGISVGDPPPPTPPDPDGPANPDDSDCAKGSQIYCQSRTLGETVRIAGTPFSLQYSSATAQVNVTAGRTMVVE
ncbi:MAG: MopE-related protein, partial [Polyangiales bacterium]